MDYVDYPVLTDDITTGDHAISSKEGKPIYIYIYIYYCIEIFLLLFCVGWGSKVWESILCFGNTNLVSILIFSIQ